MSFYRFAVGMRVFLLFQFSSIAGFILASILYLRGFSRRSNFFADPSDAEAPAAVLRGSVFVTSIPVFIKRDPFGGQSRSGERG